MTETTNPPTLADTPLEGVVDLETGFRALRVVRSPQKAIRQKALRARTTKAQKFKQGVRREKYRRKLAAWANEVAAKQAREAFLGSTPPVIVPCDNPENKP